MGIFDSKSESTTTTNNYDQRTIEETQNEGELSGNKGTIDYTYNYTGGEAFDLAGKVIDTLAESSKNTEKSNSALFGSLAKQQSEILTGGQTGIVDTLSKNMKWVFIAGFAAWGLSRFKK